MKPREVARIRIQSSWGTYPIPVHTIRLIQSGDIYRVVTIQKTGRERRTWDIDLPANEAIRQLELLRTASVPAFPVSPPVCDGDFVELTVHGQLCDLTLNWSGDAPEGADALAAFAIWLRSNQGQAPV